MSFLNALITLSLIIFISASQPGTGARVHTCSKSTKCTLMKKCPTVFFSGDRKNFPPICKWENSDPWVCCPIPAKFQTEPTTEFPENECDGPQSSTLFAIGLSRLIPPNLINIGLIGGENVKSRNNYPFMAAIYQIAGKEKVFLCGGTLLSKDVILTAAHCFLAKKDSSKYMVQLGSIIFGTGETDLKEFQVSSVKIHEQFKYPLLYNDIALVKFEGLKSFSAATRPVCLLDKAKDTKANSQVTVLGWGSKQMGGSLSSILQEITIQAISNSECNSTLAKLGALAVSFPKGIVNEIMCAGGPDNAPKDACQGDSGGPLVALIDGKWRQRGIVSGGIGCGIPGNPGLYTRVAEYIPWIKTNS